MSSDVELTGKRLARELTITVLLYAFMFVYTVSVIVGRHDWVLVTFYLSKGLLLVSTYFVAIRKPDTGSDRGDEAVIRKGYACMIGFIIFSAISDYSFLLALRHNHS